jgi:toxin ParE1/3/4
MAYKIKIEPAAKLDIQESINWYNKQQKGLGKKFHSTLLKHIDSLTTNPHFEIRYDEIHCLPLKKYPFMIHLTITKSSKTTTIRAVFHTSLDPKNWKKD